MEKEKKELQTVIKKIEELQSSIKSITDFFKQKSIKDEIKKCMDRKVSLENKIRHLQELAGELKMPAPQTKEEERQVSDVDRKDLINGPCHEVIKTAGGKGQSEIHYYATEIPGENKIKLEYLAPNGKSTGLLAKKIPKEEFLSKLFLCVEHGCNIVKK